MERRAFIGGLAAGIGAIGSLSGVAPAATRRDPGLAEDLKTARDPKAYWARLKEEFVLKPGLIHMNTGSVGSCPRSVIDAVTEAMFALEADPVSNEFGPMGAQMEGVRAKAAEFLGANLDEMVITQNTTEGMNTVATGLDLKPGDEVLTTNHEHPGGLFCWDYLAKTRGIKVVQITMPVPVKDKAQFLELVERSITPRTRVCSFQHVDTITGMRLPIADVAKITRPRGILLACDGAQAPGMLKIDVKALGVDTYASSSHKWLLAPKGSGLLYIRKEVQDRIQPVLLYSGYNVYTATSGTRDLPHILAHGTAIDFHNTIGRDRVEARCLELDGLLRERLREVPAMRLLTPDQPELSSGMASYALPKEYPFHDVYSRLMKEDVVVKPVAKADYNALRISTHVYNDEGEIDKVVGLLKSMLGA